MFVLDSSHLQERYQRGRNLGAKFRNLEILYFCIESCSFLQQITKNYASQSRLFTVPHTCNVEVRNLS